MSGTARALARLVLALALGAAALLVARRLEVEREVVTGTARVIDGDSLRLGGRELRLARIDAPELAQSCGEAGRTRPCGREARARLAALAGEGPFTCRLLGPGRYGRDLAVCAGADGAEVNAALVREGWAVAFGGYRREEAEARAAGRGLWAGPFERPQDWRRAHPR